MPKPFPRRISLKKRRCPECKKPLSFAQPALVQQAVEARCATPKCGHSFALFWLGDVKPKPFELN